MSNRVTIVGAGLAGSECAYQLAERGFEVELIEQKPSAKTPAQSLSGYTELVCSNSFRGNAIHNAVGGLKEEMRQLGSVVMRIGEEHRVPAGGAMAVDRNTFSAAMTELLKSHPRIEIKEELLSAIPQRDHPVVLATGPLTCGGLAEDLAAKIGTEHLAYYDAIAPILVADSINMDIAFRQSRYDKGDGDDYINCPMNEEQYKKFIADVNAAEKVEPREFEKMKFFEGCLPIEVLAERGEMTLAFGCMKPVGITDPKTGEQPYAVIQLRQEDRDKTAYNMVGFQTRMKWPEQKRIFATIPGLENVEFERMGSVHRNTFVHSPTCLSEDYSLKAIPNVWLAGQIAGVEGYVESAACGLAIAILLEAKIKHGNESLLPPEETALGGLMRYLRRESPDFQPANVMWNMVPKMPGRKIRKRKFRREALANRALEKLNEWKADNTEVALEATQPAS